MLFSSSVLLTKRHQKYNDQTTGKNLDRLNTALPALNVYPALTALHSPDNVFIFTEQQLSKCTPALKCDRQTRSFSPFHFSPPLPSSIFLLPFLRLLQKPASHTTDLYRVFMHANIFSWFVMCNYGARLNSFSTFISHISSSFHGVCILCSSWISSFRLFRFLAVY